MSRIKKLNSQLRQLRIREQQLYDARNQMSLVGIDTYYSLGMELEAIQRECAELEHLIRKFGGRRVFRKLPGCKQRLKQIRNEPSRTGGRDWWSAERIADHNFFGHFAGGYRRRLKLDLHKRKEFLKGMQMEVEEHYAARRASRDSFLVDSDWDDEFELHSRFFDVMSNVFRKDGTAVAACVAPVMEVE